jgi:hypothetical protein
VPLGRKVFQVPQPLWEQQVQLAYKGFLVVQVPLASQVLLVKVLLVPLASKVLQDPKVLPELKVFQEFQLIWELLVLLVLLVLQEKLAKAELVQLVQLVLQDHEVLLVFRELRH